MPDTVLHRLESAITTVAQKKKRKLQVPSPPRDIPKASNRLRVPSPPPVPTVGERNGKEGKKQKAAKGGGGSAAAGGSSSSVGYVDVYGAEVI